MGNQVGEVRLNGMSMRHASRSIGFVALVAACIGVGGCAGSKAAQQPKSPVEVLVPRNVSNDQLGEAVYDLLMDGSDSGQRAMLLAGAVRRQFARAAHLFDQGYRERGLSLVRGALLLLRIGEMRLEMLDPAAAKALGSAAEVMAQRGREGPSLALLTLQSKALPTLDPKQQAIRQHIDALNAWLKDTRQRSPLENAGADVNTYTENAMLDGSEASVKRAAQAIEVWIQRSIEFNNHFNRSRESPAAAALSEMSDRAQMIEAFRGLNISPVVLAGLYLRDGDASAALRAIEQSDARKLARPDHLAVLQEAAQERNAEAFKALSMEYLRVVSASESGESGAPEVVPLELARSAAWGGLVASYRSAQDDPEVAFSLASLLASHGYPETAMRVLDTTATLQATYPVLVLALREAAQWIIGENEVEDYAAACRVFNRTQHLISLSLKNAEAEKLKPLIAHLYMLMAEIHAHNDNRALAVELLQQSVKLYPSPVTYVPLAQEYLARRQASDVLETVGRLLGDRSSADEAPVKYIDALLLQFDAYRLQGDARQATASLQQAYRAVRRAVGRVTDAESQVQLQAQYARIQYYFGNASGCRDAAVSMLDQARADVAVRERALVNGVAAALLCGESRAAREVFVDSADGADTDNVVYAALWTHLAISDARNQVRALRLSLIESPAAAQPAGSADARRRLVVRDPQIVSKLETVTEEDGWVYWLAQHGLGKITDAQLRAKANLGWKKIEAEFYIGMSSIASDPGVAKQSLQRVVNSGALFLIEAFLASEFLATTQPGTWGKVPNNP